MTMERSKGPYEAFIWKIVNTATRVTLSHHWNPTSFNARAQRAKWLWMRASGCESVATCKSVQDSAMWNANVMHVNAVERTLRVLNWSSACKWKRMRMQESVTCRVEREPMLDVRKPISERQLRACVKRVSECFECWDERRRATARDRGRECRTRANSGYVAHVPPEWSDRMALRRWQGMDD